jgi:hypothetical protein
VKPRNNLCLFTRLLLDGVFVFRCENHFLFYSNDYENSKAGKIWFFGLVAGKLRLKSVCIGLDRKRQKVHYVS